MIKSCRINLGCAACGEKVAVESMHAAANEVCLHCGRTVIGGREPSLWLDLGRQTGFSPMTYRRRSYGGGSLGITVLAFTNLLFGVLSLLAGLCIGLMMPFLYDPCTITALRRSGLSEAQLVLLTEYLAVVLVVAIILGLAHLSAGNGLLRRDPFSRYLTMGLGGLYGVFALLGLVEMDFWSLILDGGYCVLVFAVLLGPGDDLHQ